VEPGPPEAASEPEAAPVVRPRASRPRVAPRPARRRVEPAPPVVAENVPAPVVGDARDEDPAGPALDEPPAEPRGGEGESEPRDRADRDDAMTLPANAELRLVLETPLSSETSQAGERVVARVERAISEDGRVVLPGGTVVRGAVVRADSAGRVKGRSYLAVDFDRIVVRGREYRLDASPIEVMGADGRRRDAATVAGGAAAGAILGGITKKGVKKGAVIGGLAGAGAVLATKGEEIEMPSGSRWTVRVKSPVRLQ
jgi:hypothetical protein